MRWHVGITEHDVEVWTEHVETLDLVRSTTDELIRGAHQKLGVSEERASRVHRKIVDTEFRDPEPGSSWAFELGQSDGAVEIRIGCLAEGDTDEDCSLCASQAAKA